MMMNSKVKKAILAGLSAVVSISVLAGCGGGSGSSDKASLKGKELKVATGIYAPFAFKDETVSSSASTWTCSMPCPRNWLYL